jgi:CubicO group peptidase (beta-lactamase class C family)
MHADKALELLRPFLVVLLLAAPMRLHAAGCTEPVGRDFVPGTPAEAGLSAARLAQMLEALDTPRHEVRALLVLKDCKLVMERYKDGLGRDYGHSLYSVTKSFNSTLVGALLYQGRLKNVDTPVADIIPRPDRFSDANWAKARQVTLKNAMQMSSGLEYKHDPCCHPIYDVREDRLSWALTPAFAAAPGTRFLYSDGDASISGAAVAALAGRDLLAYAKEALFAPLRIDDVEWMFRDRAGRYPGGWGLRLRPMDMLKLGQLYVQGGEWNGQRIFAPEYPALAWTAGPNKAYGLHWWIADPAVFGTPYYWAQGFKGQRIFVFPEWRMVVAVVASLPGEEEPAVMRIVVRGLVEAVRAGASADPAAEAALKQKQAAGFRGETRVKQDNQDAPRRF